MQFGIREICDVVLKAKATTKLGKKTFYKGEPILYFDTLKTSSLEQQASTVYAQGGAGNSRLISWDGEKTVTFTMEDALLSKESFAILAAAEIVDRDNLQVRFTERTMNVTREGDVVYIALKTAPVYTGGRGEINGNVMIIYDEDEYSEPYKSWIISPADAPAELQPVAQRGMLIGIAAEEGYAPDLDKFTSGCTVLFDGYEEVEDGEAVQINITPEILSGNYYLEGTTLFKNTDGSSVPAHFIIPNCKVQSNFTFTMASTGDPSTFTFTMDALPDYLAFDKTKKRFAAIQIEMSDQEEEEERDRTDHKWPIARATDVYEDSITFKADIPFEIDPFEYVPYAFLKIRNLLEEKIRYVVSGSGVSQYRSINFSSQVKNNCQILVSQESYWGDPPRATVIRIEDPNVAKQFKVGDIIEFDIYTTPLDFSNTVETTCINQEIELTWNDEAGAYINQIILSENLSHHLDKTFAFAMEYSLYPYCFKLTYDEKEITCMGYYESDEFGFDIGREDDKWQILFAAAMPKTTEKISKFIKLVELAPPIDAAEIYRGMAYFISWSADDNNETTGAITFSIKDEDFEDNEHYNICINDDNIPIIEVVYDKTNDKFTSIEPDLLSIEKFSEDPPFTFEAEYVVIYTGDPTPFFSYPSIGGVLSAGIPSLIKILKKN